MTGKDLFAALSHVDDALVAEAEDYKASRVLPLPVTRWLGTLAACFCLLVVWAVLARTGVVNLGTGGASTEAAIEESTTVVTEEAAAAEEAEAGFTEETAEETVEGAEAEEAETAGQENGMAAGGTKPTEEPMEDEVAYVIFESAPPSVKTKEETQYSCPSNGALILDEDVQNTLDMLALVNLAKPARFLITFDLYRDGQKLDPESAEYRAEVERLTEQGYEFRTLNVQHRDKSVWVQVCGLFTEAQLTQFAASEDYGYFLFFPENEDGTPLNWDDEAALCGVSSAEE